MDLEKEILREHSKHQAVRIAKWIGSDKRRFGELMDLFLKGEYRVTQRAAWIVKHCGDEHAGLVYPYLNEMIDRMLEPGVHERRKKKCPANTSGCRYTTADRGQNCNGMF